MAEDTTAKNKDTATTENEQPEIPLPEPVVRKQKANVGGKTVAYTTTAGQLPIKDDKGETQANLYFTAYTLDNHKEGQRRPITFTFNGGPGSASVWLHMGGLAPKRVEMLDDGGMPRPPYNIIDNDFSWIEATDLVFIDPVDTGYSRATSDEFAKKVEGRQGRPRIGRRIHPPLPVPIPALDVARCSSPARATARIARPVWPGIWPTRASSSTASS